jgi:hypothetical protein
VRAEPVAQALRFGDPDAAEFRPERLDQLHLIAMRDDAPAQIVQFLRRDGAPVFARRVLAHAPIRPGQFAGELAEAQPVERPTVDAGDDLIQCHDEPRAHRLRDACGFGALAQRVEPGADRGQ